MTSESHRPQVRETFCWALEKARQLFLRGGKGPQAQGPQILKHYCIEGQSPHRELRVLLGFGGYSVCIRYEVPPPRPAGRNTVTLGSSEVF